MVQFLTEDLRSNDEDVLEQSLKDLCGITKFDLNDTHSVRRARGKYRRNSSSWAGMPWSQWSWASTLIVKAYRSMQ